MDGDGFAARMRGLEYFHQWRLVPGAWTIVRVDGRSFSRWTETHCEKPFDSRFHGWMRATATALLEDLQGLYAYTQSDEISVLLPRNWSTYDRVLEKVVSLSAGCASATFSLACGTAATFDARIWHGIDTQDVVDYFRWRQSDAARCGLNTCCYWTLRRSGLDERAATKKLDGSSVSDKNELLFAHGVNFNELPAWQRRGVAVVWEEFEREGRDPRTGQAVTTQRRRSRIIDDIPVRDAYGEWIREMLVG